MPNTTEMDSGLQEGKIQFTGLSSSFSQGTDDDAKFGELEHINSMTHKNLEVMNLQTVSLFKCSEVSVFRSSGTEDQIVVVL
jgi:hypothetical protein